MITLKPGERVACRVPSLTAGYVGVRDNQGTPEFCSARENRWRLMR
jgi:hypothetical protein